MTSEKLDRRKKYTRMVLKDSLLELLNEKPFSAITVKEICGLADINRSTFYAHYEDQFSLLETIENDIVADLEEHLQVYNLCEEENDIQMTVKLIEYFGAKKDELEVLLKRDGESSFEKKIMIVAQQFLINEWIETNQISAESSAYLSMFIISGSVQVIKMWLLSGMKESPKQMATLIHTQINYGIYNRY